MKIYTKTGDKGETALIGGNRVSKNNAQVEAYGTIDELNSFIGLLNDAIRIEACNQQLLQIQHTLFVVGTHLAADPSKELRRSLPKLQCADIESLEKWIDEMDAQLPTMTHFILPGGHTTISYAHVCRTICRRAERQIVSLNCDVDFVKSYINRLSDYFFVLARYLALQLNIEEIKWIPST